MSKNNQINKIRTDALDLIELFIMQGGKDLNPAEVSELNALIRRYVIARNN